VSVSHDLTQKPSDLSLERAEILFGDDQPRGFVFGAHAWNHPIIGALFATEKGHPEFCASFDEAIGKARRAGGRLVAWSSRFTTEHEQRCRAEGVERLLVEDGFVRSIGLGAGFAMACSLAVDRRGMHYDARGPSDLETMLECLDLCDAHRERGTAIVRRLVASGLSKYNVGSARIGRKLPGDREIVLVPGQVSDDRSILSLVSETIDRGAAECVNEQLLRQARERWRDGYIIYKPHPDVAAGLRRGALSRQRALKYADAVAGDTDISSLLGVCDVVETISSLTGFEALVRNRHVRVHGVPFYAGWGLTEDLTVSPRRRRRRTIDELVYIALVVYTLHIDPVTRGRCTVEALIEALVRQRHDRATRTRNSVMQRVAKVYAKLGV